MLIKLLFTMSDGLHTQPNCNALFAPSSHTQSLDRRKQKRLDREKSRDQTAKLTAVMEQR